MKKFTPIPNTEFAKPKDIPINDNGEKLIGILPNSYSKILIEPIYYKNGLNGAINAVYVRESVLIKLLEATRILPSGFKFKIFDAWRPLLVQKAIYENFEKKIIKDNLYNNPISIKEEVEKFVSYYSKDVNKPFVHSTGGAVDLTIVDKVNNNLNMGTQFDDFSNVSNTSYYEAIITESINIIENTVIAKNRRMLYNIMESVGFTNLPSEWWHFDYGDLFWAYYTNSQSIYAGVYQL